MAYVPIPPAAQVPWLQMYTRNIERAIEAATLSDLPTFADDTAAGTGGLVAGQFYKTSAGAVMVKL